MFVVLLGAYSQVGLLCFGTFSASFRTFSSSMGTLLDLLTRNGSAHHLQELGRIIAPIYISSFLIFVFLLFTALVGVSKGYDCLGYD